MKRAPLEFFCEMARTGSQAVPIRLGFETIYLVNHPGAVQHIFRDNRDNYVRSKFYRHIVPFLGQGLFSVEGPEWRKQRSGSQPAFSGPNLHKMVDEMAAGIGACCLRMKNFSAAGSAFDFRREAFRLKLDILMRALFSTRLEGAEFSTILNSLTLILREIDTRMWAPFSLPTWVPTRRNRVLSTALSDLNAIIEKVISDRLAAGESKEDLLDLLIEQARAEGWTANTRTSLRDQLVSLIIAGHETSSNALAWLMYEISKRPEVARRLRREANAVLDGEGLSFQTYQRLPYTQQVFKEILRIYPPLWTFSRQTLAPDRLGKVAIPEGAVVMVSPYVLHRHPRFWTRPEAFEPERFAPDQEAARHKYLYLPFGAGPHLCLGNRFAMLEGVLAIASLFRRFDFEVAPATVTPEAMTTLRPAQPVMTRVSTAAGAARLAA